MAENADKPNPNGWNPDRTKGEFNWYTQQNIDRLWKNGLSNGEFMICHSTDPDSENYGWVSTKPGHERLCVGSIMLQYAHFKVFEQKADALGRATPAKKYASYKLAAGAVPMKRAGMLTWALSMAYGRTHFPLGLPIPRQLSENRPLRVPSGDLVVKPFYLKEMTQEGGVE